MPTWTWQEACSTPVPPSLLWAPAICLGFDLLWSLAHPTPPAVRGWCPGLWPRGGGYLWAGRALDQDDASETTVTTPPLPQKAVLFVQTPGRFPGAPASGGHQAPGSHRQARRPQGNPGRGIRHVMGRTRTPPRLRTAGQEERGFLMASPATSPSRDHPVGTCATIFWGHLGRPLPPQLGAPTEA